MQKKISDQSVEHMGTCRYCRQLHVIGYDNGDLALELVSKGMEPEAALDEQATRQCTCNEGLIYRKGIKQARDAEEECKRLFGDIPEAYAVISASVEGLAVGKLKEIRVSVDTSAGSVKASARRTAQGGINMKRTDTAEEGVSV